MAFGTLITAVISANMPWLSGRSPKCDLAELRKAKVVKMDGSNMQINGQEWSCYYDSQVPRVAPGI